MKDRFSAEEWNQLKVLPFQVFILTAGADGRIDKKELEAVKQQFSEADGYDRSRHLSYGGIGYGGDLRPDLTVIFDVPVATGLGRRRAACGGQRFEQMTEAFHERVRQGFLTLARAEPKRCAVVDATRSIEAVAADVRDLVARRFGLDLAPAV